MGENEKTSKRKTLRYGLRNNLSQQCHFENGFMGIYDTSLQAAKKHEAGSGI
ncbi:MAG: hypothetical protein ABJA57_10745 [Ginsengibacter sp.]